MVLKLWCWGGGGIGGGRWVVVCEIGNFSGSRGSGVSGSYCIRGSRNDRGSADIEGAFNVSLREVLVEACGSVQSVYNINSSSGSNVNCGRCYTRESSGNF